MEIFRRASTLRQSPSNIVEFLIIRLGGTTQRQNIDWFFVSSFTWWQRSSFLRENSSKKQTFFLSLIFFCQSNLQRWSRLMKDETFICGFWSVNKSVSEQSYREESTLWERKSLQWDVLSTNEKGRGSISIEIGLLYEALYYFMSNSSIRCHKANSTKMNSISPRNDGSWSSEKSIITVYIWISAIDAKVLSHISIQQSLNVCFTGVVSTFSEL